VVVAKVAVHTLSRGLVQCWVLGLVATVVSAI
jgi:hypothetical protein